MVEWELDAALPPVPPTHIEEGYTSFYALDADGVAGNDLALRLHPNGLCVVTLAPSHAALSGGSGGSGSGKSASAGPAAAAAAAAEAAAAAAPPSEPNVQAGSEERQQAALQPPATATGAPQPQQQQDGGSAGPPSLERAAAAAGAGSADARLALNEKLMHAEYRKGRGPLLQPESILGRLTAGGATHVLRCGVRGLLVDFNSKLHDLQGPALLRALDEGYIAILELRAAEAQQLAARCLTEQLYQQRRSERQQAAGQVEKEEQEQHGEEEHMGQEQQAEAEAGAVADVGAS